MFDNDDAEYARREHDYEMGGQSDEDRAYEKFKQIAVDRLVAACVTTPEQGLDGNQESDGFSLDLAYELFLEGHTPEDFVTGVFFERGLRGFRDGDAT
jgi:1,2-phenylacetyl-CoA epoxidase catalytic subunit